VGIIGAAIRDYANRRVTSFLASLLWGLEVTFHFPCQPTLFPVNAPPVLGARSLRSDSKLRGSVSRPYPSRWVLPVGGYCMVSVALTSGVRCGKSKSTLLSHSLDLEDFRVSISSCLNPGIANPCCFSSACTRHPNLIRIYLRLTSFCRSWIASSGWKEYRLA
jgi:hypothetical protein